MICIPLVQKFWKIQGKSITSYFASQNICLFGLICYTTQPTVNNYFNPKYTEILISLHIDTKNASFWFVEEAVTYQNLIHLLFSPIYIIRYIVIW